MLIVFVAIIVIVCVYTVYEYGRQPSNNLSPMRRSFRLSVRKCGEDRNKSDLLTEESCVENSASDDSCVVVSDDSAEINEVTANGVGVYYSEFIDVMDDKLQPESNNGRNVSPEQDDISEDFSPGENKSRSLSINDTASTADESQSSSTNSRRTSPRVNAGRKPAFNWRAKRDKARSQRKTQAKRSRKSRNDTDEFQETHKQMKIHHTFGQSESNPQPEVEPAAPLYKRIFKHIKIAMDEEKPVVHEVLQIAGVTVKFPVKPYPSQIAVMSKLIQGCKKAENCLLESPTGSGKTLALLCGALAWQEREQEEFQRRTDEMMAQQIQADFDLEYATGAASTQNEAGSRKIEENAGISKALVATDIYERKFPSCSENSAGGMTELSRGDGDFQPSKKFCQSQSPSKINDVGIEAVSDKLELPTMEANKPKKVPTVYYGSRTHKQIEQVVRELKKTAYAYKKMTILSSREFSCIQETNRSKTELCNKLLDPANGMGCKYNHDRSRKKIASNKALNELGVVGPWDIEDLVELGKQHMACPYFAARDLMTEADVVFCPYNYLVDPNIRQIMQINLSGQIVILDEAHNIEDMSRDVGSVHFREDRISEVVKECEALLKSDGIDWNTYRTIELYLRDLLRFIRANNLELVDTFSDTASSKCWTGPELLELFAIHSLGGSQLNTFTTATAAAIMDFNKAKEDVSMKTQESMLPVSIISQKAKLFLDDLIMGLSMIASQKFAPDYRACIVESTVKDTQQATANTWIYANESNRLRTLELLCMNPAVTFAPLAALARTVILASGTLSPITSFQSELGTTFLHKLNANHVVPQKNVYIRGIPCGPTGVELRATYANVNSWRFQDELGRLIFQVCNDIPHGVLCFFSSYGVMQKQINRWKQSSQWEQIAKIKDIYQEPRGSANLEQVMRDFRECIQRSSDGPQDGITGALMFAVFRGKIAEGIDFSDNEARCVMAVGIPYAVRKDPIVDMKVCYNDLRVSEGLLRGSEWYTVQAFRALNQALGRCVRHQNDWGALLLTDSRFLERFNVQYLPKWVKSMWRNSENFNLTKELRNFVQTHVQETLGDC